MTWRTSGWPGFGPNLFRGLVQIIDGGLSAKGDITLDDGATFTTTLQCVTATAARYVSIPDASGVIGLVGGASGQLTWNSSGAYAGVTSSTVDSSGNVTLGGTLTTTGRVINSIAAAASAPPVSITGTWFSGGTSTTTKPQLLVEASGATSTGWSTSGTGLGVNAASGFTGRLLDLQLNGATRANIDSSGNLVLSGSVIDTFTTATTTYAASVALDLAALNGTYRTISLSGDLTLTTSNRAAGRSVVLRLICDATQRTLNFPAGWVFVGTKPANIAASKTAILSLSFFGTADTDGVAAYAVQS